MEIGGGAGQADNAFIESFNGTLRDECLNVHCFDDMKDAKEKLEAWRREYNETRPHRSLNDLSPLEYRAQWAKRRSEIH
jgi:putative transposase